MKRFFAFAAIAAILMGSLTLNAQNKFKGIVKYTVTSTGDVAIDIPEQIATADVKVMGDRLFTNSMLFTNSPVMNCLMQEGRSVTRCYDFSMLLGFLASNDIELTTYKGDGKIFNSTTVTQTDIDSLTIPVTEGFYVEYIDGQTQKVAGYEARLARVHIFDDEGVDSPIDFWYTDEIGPEVNFLVSGIGIKGMPLMFTQSYGGGQAITITASEVVKGKVKDVDFLMPAGFKPISDKDFGAFMQEVQEEMEYLQDDDE